MKLVYCTCIVVLQLNDIYGNYVMHIYIIYIVCRYNVVTAVWHHIVFQTLKIVAAIIKSIFYDFQMHILSYNLLICCLILIKFVPKWLFKHVFCDKVLKN